MPPRSGLRDFVHALATGETNVTRVLEAVVNDAELRAVHAAKFETPGALNGQMPGWLQTLLIQHGMSEAETEHIERWPDKQKEVVRSRLQQACAGGKPLRFSWELYPGGEPLSEVCRDPDQEVRVVFRSPRKGVRLAGRVHVGDVRVDT